MKRSSIFLIIASLSFWLCFYFLTDYYDRTYPESPDESTHRTYELVSHGHFVYLNAKEHYLLFFLVSAGVGCFLGAFLIERKRKDGERLSESGESRAPDDHGNGDDFKLP